MAKFPFSDLHSFKDYVIFVQSYLPDRFGPRDSVGPQDQWTMDLAFKGLRLGLDMAVEEKGERPALSRCRELVDEAYDLYSSGDDKSGFKKLEEVNTLLRKIPSQ